MSRLALVREDVLDDTEDPNGFAGGAELLFELTDDSVGRRLAELNPAADEAVEVLVLDAVVAVDQEQLLGAADDSQRDRSNPATRRSPLRGARSRRAGSGRAG